MTDLLNGSFLVCSFALVDSHTELCDRIVELLVLVWSVHLRTFLEDFSDVFSFCWQFEILTEVDIAVVRKDELLSV